MYVLQQKEKKFPWPGYVSFSVKIWKLYFNIFKVLYFTGQIEWWFWIFFSLLTLILIMTQKTCFRISKRIKCDVLQPTHSPTPPFFKGYQLLQKCSSGSIVRHVCYVGWKLYQYTCSVSADLLPMGEETCFALKASLIDKIQSFLVSNHTLDPLSPQRLAEIIFQEKTRMGGEKNLLLPPFFPMRPIGNSFISDMGIKAWQGKQRI